MILKEGILQKHNGNSIIKEGYEMRLIRDRELGEVVAL